MPPRDSEEPLDWVRRAREDLEAAQFLHAHGKAPAVVAVQIQQAAEKALKGLLLALGCPVRRSHDLELLLADAAAIDPGFRRFEEFCGTATAFFGFERYPTLAGPLVADEDLAEALRDADALVRAVEEKLR